MQYEFLKRLSQNDREKEPRFTTEAPKSSTHGRPRPSSHVLPNFPRSPHSSPRPRRPAARRPFCQGKWTCRGDLQSGGRPPVPADARERGARGARSQASPRSRAHGAGCASVAGRGGPSHPAYRSHRTAGPDPRRALRPLQLHLQRAGRRLGGRGVGAFGGPPKTYHGPGGKQGLNIHPSHTYTAQPPRLGGNKTRRRAGAGESVPCSRAQ